MESKVEVKVEPAEIEEPISPEPTEQDVLPSEAVDVKSEPMNIDLDENEVRDIKNEFEESSSDEASGVGVEQLTVKVEPNYYSSENESESNNFRESVVEQSGPSCSDDSPPDDSPPNREAGRSNYLSFYDLQTSWLENERYGEGQDEGQSDYSTDSSISDVSDDEEDNVQDARASTSSEDTLQYYYGRNNFKWSRTPVNTTETPDVLSNCQPTDELRGLRKNPYFIWKYFMDDILKDMLKWTNIKISEIRSYFKNDSRPELEELALVEFEAFFGILMFGALVKVNQHHPNSIFEHCSKSIPIFSVTMSKDRFLVILNCLQFGDPENGNDPSGDVNMGLIYERALSKSQELYHGSQCAMVMDAPVLYYGDNLPPQYLPYASANGFTMPCLCDVTSGYFYYCYVPYKDLQDRDFTQQEKKLSARTQQVLLMTRQLHGTNRNITCYKRYTSLELINVLLKKKLTYVGNIKKDKKEIPREFLPSKQRQKGSVLYGFTENITLMSLMKDKTAYIIASSKHHKEETAESGLPEMLEFYNSTITYTDTGYDEPEKTVTRRTKLISMAHFYRFLDILMFNTHILYQMHYNKRMPEYQTMQKLAWMLVYEHLLKRAYNVKVPLHLRLHIIKIMSQDCTEETGKKKGTCASCPATRKRKTSRKCVICQRYLCRRCSHVMCNKCNMERAARI